MKSGVGLLLYDQGVVRVIPMAESAWKSANRAGWKAERKLRNAEGDWSVWFLLSRALVLSRTSLIEAERGIGPACSEIEAERQLRSAGKAQALAADARQYALLQALMHDESIPLEVAATEVNFIEWFGCILANRLAEGDFKFVETVTGYAKAAYRLPQSGFPSDVKSFCRILARLARETGEPPTKEKLRLALGAEETKKLAKPERVSSAGDPSEKSIWSESSQPESASETIRGPDKPGKWVRRGAMPPVQRKSDVPPQGSNEVFDESKFKRLLKRTGFEWLPMGKTGPKRKQTSGGKAKRN
jgi:hypothetical protein